MIQVKTLDEARILIVGGGNLVTEITRSLENRGVSSSNIILVDSSANINEESPRTIRRDAEEFIRSDGAFFKSFDIVLSANQPRAFEMALSNLRWPENGTNDDSDLPIMVMRSVLNTCKMRCQYRELLVNGFIPSRYVSLPMELPPWTDEKRTLVVSVIQQEFQPDRHQNYQAYFIAARTVVDFQKAHGSWPDAKDKQQLNMEAKDLEPDVRAKAERLIDLFCEQGLAAAEETITILSRLVALDAIKLLSGKGQPINHTNMEEVILLTAQTLI